MQTSARHALDDIEAARAPHRYSHRCLDGVWYATNVTPGQHCPTYEQLSHAAAHVLALAGDTLAAADDPDARRAVAEGMTGLIMADLDTEGRDGWLETAGMAIQALAVWQHRHGSDDAPVSAATPTA